MQSKRERVFLVATLCGGAIAEDNLLRQVSYQAQRDDKARRQVVREKRDSSR
jgi:hypothetical protein